MVEIGDELRELAVKYCYQWTKTYKDMCAIADRIDAEMTKWPLGADGKPIRVGETVYHNDRKEWTVRAVTISKYNDVLNGDTVFVIDDSGQTCNFRPDSLTHKCPDSFECIAQELEDMSENFRMTDQESFSELLDFADRIRNLAEKDE